MRILIADDETQVRSALRFLLEQKSLACHCSEAQKAEFILPAVAGFQPEVLLLDWEMVAGDKPGFIKEVRQIAHRVVVLALSGFPESRKTALRAGADYFICKNDAPENLLAVLQGLNLNSEINTKGEE
jgi:DNA-binding NarL/FixJ family response regulator